MKQVIRALGLSALICSATPVIAIAQECSLVAIRLGFCTEGVAQPKQPLAFPAPIEFPSLVLPFFGMSSIPSATAAAPTIAQPPIQPYYPHRKP